MPLTDFATINPDDHLTLFSGSQQNVLVESSEASRVLPDDHAAYCSCPGCSGPEEQDDYGMVLTTQYEIDPSNPDSGDVGTNGPNGKPIWSAFQTAAHINRPYGAWTEINQSMTVTYSFPTALTVEAGYDEMSTADQTAVRKVLDLYEDITGLIFVEVPDATDGSANLRFRNIEGTTNGGGNAQYPNSSYSNVNIGYVTWNPDSLVGEYRFRLILHEVGHALGMAHPGPYNGNGYTYAGDADHWNDTRQYSNMSYWDEGESGADFGYMTTAALHDILAMQMEYGANMSTRTGDTTYGYNDTTGLQSYDLTHQSDMAFSIWDAGGEDTLDFSGSTADTEMDLRAGSFSSVNGQTYNISIAYNVTIENAVGSDNDDVIRGNEVSNILRGGSGNDTITGGDASDPSSTPDPRHFTGVLLNADPLQDAQFVRMDNVTGFSGGEFTIEVMVMIDRISGSMIPFFSYATGATANAVLIAGYRDDVLSVFIQGARWDSSILTETIVDGQPHRISVRFDSTSGNADIFIDGVLEDSGFVTNSAPADGGTLILGQEQDSIGGGYNIREVFSGTIGDVRIFSELRGNNQILNNIFDEIHPNSAGLEHYVKASEGGGGSVTDIVGGETVTIGSTDASADPTVNDTTPALLSSDDDILHGDEGNDILSGGAGDDILYGEGTAPLPTPPIVFNLLETDRNPSVIRSNTTSEDFTPTGSFTFEFLLQQGDLSTAGYHIDFANASFYRWADGTLSFLFFDATEDDWHYNAIPANSYDPSALNRISVTYDDSTGDFAVYVNGTVTYQATFTPGTRAMTAGDIQFELDDALFGDVRVYDTALDAATIAANAYDVIADPDTEPNLIQYWQIVSGAPVQQITGGATMTPIGSPSATTGTMFTQSFDDILNGGIGNDTLNGGIGTNTLNGDNGNDTFIGGPGTDAMDGGNGNDLVTYEASASDVFVNLNSGVGQNGDADGDTYSNIEQANGTAFDDRLVADSTGSVLRGLDGNDDMRGHNGDDTLQGGEGDDLLRSSTGSDFLNGGADRDTVTYAASSIAVTVDLDNDAANAGGAAGDSLVSIEKLIGSDFDDTLYGRDGLRDELLGSDGDDSLYGRDGIDTLRGGEGADFLSGGAGIDTATYTTAASGVTVDLLNASNNTGEAAGDTFDSIEQVFGSDFDDTLSGDGGDNFLRGRDGEDVISGLGGDDRILGDGGNDFMYGGGGIDFLNGGDDDDTIEGGNHDDKLIGGDGADELDGGNGSDFAMYRGSASGVAVDLSAGTASGGEAAGDTLTDIENLVCSSFADTLVGDSNDNDLRGAAGDDILNAKSGTNFLRGNSGRDTFVFEAVSTGRTVVRDFAAGEEINLVGFSYANTTQAGADFTQSGSDVVYDNGSLEIVFRNAALADVQAALTLSASVPYSPGEANNAPVTPATPASTAMDSDTDISDGLMMPLDLGPDLPESAFYEIA